MRQSEAAKRAESSTWSTKAGRTALSARDSLYARLKLWKAAKEATERAAKYAYRDRRARKRDFRQLWIMRINAAARPLGLSYSRLMNGLKKASIAVDRKVLADIAVLDKPAFSKFVEKAKASLGA